MAGTAPGHREATQADAATGSSTPATGAMAWILNYPVGAVPRDRRSTRFQESTGSGVRVESLVYALPTRSAMVGTYHLCHEISVGFPARRHGR